MDLNEALAFGNSLADVAGPIARSYFRQPLDVESKPDLSPVTIADKEIEARLRGMIRARYPDHGILGEEQGRDATDSEYVWVLDPIDGTKSFISGNPLFGTLIALLRHGRPVLGIIDHPVLGERWAGGPGLPALLNGRACRTRACARLADAIVMSTSPDSFGAADLARFDSVSLAARLRRFGGDCYSYALLASGHIDAVLASSLQPYDFMPLLAVVESAGGVMTGWRGERLEIDDYDGRVLAAATPALHAEILALLDAGG